MKNCFSSLGRSQGGHVMLSPFSQPRYSTVLNEKSNNLLPTFSKWAAVKYYTLYSVREMGITRLLCYSTVSQKRVFFSALNFIVLNLMYHALTLAQNSYEERMCSGARASDHTLTPLLYFPAGDQTLTP